jgi:Rrf2 family protein
MIRVPKKTLYALEAVVDIAFNARPNPVQSKDISKRQGIPPRYLEQVMQELVRAGILKGVRGPRGGYMLAKERRRITIGEVVRVLGGEKADPDDDVTASEIGRTVVRPLWRDLTGMIMERLDGITLEDLCHEAQASGIRTAVSRTSDFTI